MAFTYSVAMNLEKKICAVIGGGNVAARKVQTLLEQGALVTVVSPELGEELTNQSRPFTWIPKEYSLDTLSDDTFLVIAATNSRAVNAQVARDCHENRILVNVIDSYEESDFTVNATVTRGDLQLSVSTNGISPAMSRKIRMEWENTYGPEYGVALSLMESFRREAKKQISDDKKRRAFLQQLGNMDLPVMLTESSEEEVIQRVSTCLSSYLD